MSKIPTGRATVPSGTILRKTDKFKDARTKFKSLFISKNVPLTSWALDNDPETNRLVEIIAGYNAHKNKIDSTGRRGDDLIAAVEQFQHRINVVTRGVILGSVPLATNPSLKQSSANAMRLFYYPLDLEYYRFHNEFNENVLLGDIPTNALLTARVAAANTANSEVYKVIMKDDFATKRNIAPSQYSDVTDLAERKEKKLNDDTSSQISSTSSIANPVLSRTPQPYSIIPQQPATIVPGTNDDLTISILNTLDHTNPADTHAVIKQNEAIATANADREIALISQTTNVPPAVVQDNLDQSTTPPTPQQSTITTDTTSSMALKPSNPTNRTDLPQVKFDNKTNDSSFNQLKKQKAFNFTTTAGELLGDQDRARWINSFDTLSNQNGNNGVLEWFKIFLTAMIAKSPNSARRMYDKSLEQINNALLVANQTQGQIDLSSALGEDGMGVLETVLGLITRQLPGQSTSTGASTRNPDIYQPQNLTVTVPQLTDVADNMRTSTQLSITNQQALVPILNTLADRLRLPTDNATVIQEIQNAIKDGYTGLLDRISNEFISRLTELQNNNNMLLNREQQLATLHNDIINQLTTGFTNLGAAFTGSLQPFQDNLAALMNKFANTIGSTIDQFRAAVIGQSQINNLPALPPPQPQQLADVDMKEDPGAVYEKMKTLILSGQQAMLDQFNKQQQNERALLLKKMDDDRLQQSTLTTAQETTLERQLKQLLEQLSTNVNENKITLANRSQTSTTRHDEMMKLLQTVLNQITQQSTQTHSSITNLTGSVTSHTNQNSNNILTMVQAIESLIASGRQPTTVNINGLDNLLKSIEATLRQNDELSTTLGRHITANDSLRGEIQELIRNIQAQNKFTNAELQSEKERVKFDKELIEAHKKLMGSTVTNDELKNLVKVVSQSQKGQEALQNLIRSYNKLTSEQANNERLDLQNLNKTLDNLTNAVATLKDGSAAQTNSNVKVADAIEKFKTIIDIIKSSGGASSPNTASRQDGEAILNALEKIRSEINNLRIVTPKIHEIEDVVNKLRTSHISDKSEKLDTVIVGDPKQNLNEASLEKMDDVLDALKESGSYTKTLGNLIRKYIQRDEAELDDIREIVKRMASHKADGLPYALDVLTTMFKELRHVVWHSTNTLADTIENVGREQFLNDTWTFINNDESTNKLLSTLEYMSGQLENLAKQSAYPTLRISSRRDDDDVGDDNDTLVDGVPLDEDGETDNENDDAISEATSYRTTVTRPRQNNDGDGDDGDVRVNTRRRVTSQKKKVIKSVDRKKKVMTMPLPKLQLHGDLIPKYLVHMCFMHAVDLSLNNHRHSRANYLPGYKYLGEILTSTPYDRDLLNGLNAHGIITHAQQEFEKMRQLVSNGVNYRNIYTALNNSRTNGVRFEFEKQIQFSPSLKRTFSNNNAKNLYMRAINNVLSNKQYSYLELINTLGCHSVTEQAEAMAHLKSLQDMIEVFDTNTCSGEVSYELGDLIESRLAMAHINISDYKANYYAKLTDDKLMMEEGDKLMDYFRMFFVDDPYREKIVNSFNSYMQNRTSKFNEMLNIYDSSQNIHENCISRILGKIFTEDNIPTNLFDYIDPTSIVDYVANPKKYFMKLSSAAEEKLKYSGLNPEYYENIKTVYNILAQIQGSPSATQKIAQLISADLNQLVLRNTVFSSGLTWRDMKKITTTQGINSFYNQSIQNSRLNYLVPPNSTTPNMYLLDSPIRNHQESNPLIPADIASNTPRILGTIPRAALPHFKLFEIQNQIRSIEKTKYYGEIRKLLGKGAVAKKDSALIIQGQSDRGKMFNMLYTRGWQIIDSNNRHKYAGIQIQNDPYLCAEFYNNLVSRYAITLPPGSYKNDLIRLFDMGITLNEGQGVDDFRDVLSLHKNLEDVLGYSASSKVTGTLYYTSLNDLIARTAGSMSSSQYAMVMKQIRRRVKFHTTNENVGFLRANTKLLKPETEENMVYNEAMNVNLKELNENVLDFMLQHDYIKYVQNKNFMAQLEKSRKNENYGEKIKNVIADVTTKFGHYFGDENELLDKALITTNMLKYFRDEKRGPANSYYNKGHYYSVMRYYYKLQLEMAMQLKNYVEYAVNYNVSSKNNQLLNLNNVDDESRQLLYAVYEALDMNANLSIHELYLELAKLIQKLTHLAKSYNSIKPINDALEMINDGDYKNINARTVLAIQYLLVHSGDEMIIGKIHNDITSIMVHIAQNLNPVALNYLIIPSSYDTFLTTGSIDPLHAERFRERHNKIMLPSFNTTNSVTSFTSASTNSKNWFINSTYIYLKINY